MGARGLYIGTWEGLYEARPASDGYRVRPLGLASPPGPRERWNSHRGVDPTGPGPIRCPVVADGTRLYAATNRAGVFVSEDGGSAWREINQGLVYKEIWSLARHPRTGELYAGTGPSALFKSDNGGATWIECQELRLLPSTRFWTFPGPPHVSHIRHIGFHPSDPRILYGSIEEGGVVRSRDGGASWEQLDGRHGIPDDAHSVTPLPDDPSALVATTGVGVYRSLDGGDSWVPSSTGLGDRRYLAHLVVHPDRPDVLFTAAGAVPPRDWKGGADTGFFRSDDRGESWRRLTGALPESQPAGARAVAGDPEDPDVFAVGLSDGTVWMTDDGGQRFHPVVEGLPQVTSLVVFRAA